MLDIKIMDGVEFVPLRSLDSTLCQFVTNKARFQGGASIALLQWQKDRTMATLKCTSATFAQWHQHMLAEYMSIPKIATKRFNKEVKVSN